VDLQQILQIRGMSAYVGASWGTGGNLASTLNSSILTNGLYAPSFYLGEMYLQQKFLTRKLSLRGGRLAASNAFAALPVFNNYVNYGINPNPFSLGANDITFFGPPAGTQWGVQACYHVTPAIQVAAGAFNSNVNSANGDRYGTDFTLQEGNKGVLAIGEMDYLYNQEANSSGKPGQLGTGILHSNDSFPLRSDDASHSDGYSGVYIMGQQMDYRPDGPGTFRGATVWGIWTHNSKEIISAMPSFSGAGVSYEGLIPARKSDVVSAGVVYGEASKFAPAANTEELFELNYQWNHSRYLTITPDLQYIWKHDGRNPRNATVAGIQLAITF
jgi:carbohydrate-selective porin OprB